MQNATGIIKFHHVFITTIITWWWKLSLYFICLI